MTQLARAVLPDGKTNHFAGVGLQRPPPPCARCGLPDGGILIQTQHLADFGLDNPLPFQRYHAKRRMKLGFVQKVNQIALAGGRHIKTIGAVKPHIRFQRLAPKCETRQTVHLQMPVTVQPFLSAHNYEPMIFLKTNGPGFPDFPLPDFHRSGCCGCFDMAFSSFSRSSGPG
ncbi:MAG: hypothetical protein WCF71_03045 [Verrucomicrobiia bacterium]